MEIQPVQIQTPDIVGAYTNGLQARHAMQKMQDEDRTRAAQEALRALFSRPGFDATKPEGMREVMSLDPAMGMQLRKQQAEIAKSQAESDYKRWQGLNEETKLKATAAQIAHSQYEQADPQTRDTPQAKQLFMENGLKGVGIAIPQWGDIDQHWQASMGMAQHAARMKALEAGATKAAELPYQQAQDAYKAGLDYRNSADLKGLPTYGDTHPQPQVDFQTGQAYVPGAGGAPGVIQPLPGGTNFRQQNQDYERTEKMRNHFDMLPEVKTYKEAVPVYQAAKEAAGRDNKASDLNLVYAVAKLMDPGSVVRESESAMVVASGSPAERFQGVWNSIIGGGKLTPELRKELMTEIESRMNAYRSAYDNQRQQYGKFAELAGVNPSHVFADPLEMGKPFGAGSATGGGQIPKWNPPSAPQEGDKRRGRNRAGVPIEQIYRNGQWVNL